MADYNPEFSKAIAVIIANAWADETFLEALIAPGRNLEAALATKGLKLPSIPEAPNAKLIFVANTADQRYIVIPMRPKLADDDVSLFIKLRQLETGCTDCFRPGGKLSDIVDDVKKILGLAKKNE